MFRTICAFVALAACLAALGCGHPSVKQEVIPIKAASDPLSEPKAVLRQYAEGQPFGSEVTTFPAMVDAVRKSDPARADVLEKGLAELQKASPSERPQKAKELLSKLQ